LTRPSRLPLARLGRQGLPWLTVASMWAQPPLSAWLGSCCSWIGPWIG